MSVNWYQSTNKPYSKLPFNSAYQSNQTITSLNQSKVVYIKLPILIFMPKFGSLTPNVGGKNNILLELILRSVCETIEARS